MSHGDDVLPWRLDVHGSHGTDVSLLMDLAVVYDGSDRVVGYAMPATRPIRQPDLWMTLMLGSSARGFSSSKILRRKLC